MATIAALLAWILFLTWLHLTRTSIHSIILLAVYGISTDSPEAQSALREHIITNMPTFGFSIGLFLTFGIAMLAGHIRNVRHNIRHILLRSIIATIGCYLVYFIENTIVVILNIEDYSFLLDWIPWAVAGFIITYCGTHGTRVKMSRSLVLLSVAIGLLSTYLWALFFFSTTIDFRIMLLHGFAIFAVGIALSTAMTASHSERYFLRVQGAIKTMDVALYKWFRNNPDDVVTIGKSVDCSLQLSWDITGYVAPKHAEITMREQIPYLTALEEGIFVDGEAIVSGQTVRLYHGKSFSIGNTTFTYIEKDL
jgi:hypothetical protein